MEEQVGSMMNVVKIADNILSPVGVGTSEVIDAVIKGTSGLKTHKNLFGLNGSVVASLLDRSYIEKLCSNNLKDYAEYTFFERICLLSAVFALKDTDINPASADTIFVLSSTKGNVELLDVDPDSPRCYLHNSAELIARYFNNSNTPIVVSNACISGVSAQMAATRLLMSGKYKTAIVTGADVLSKFIVSGFQSFNALSDTTCRPFDKNRKGLNLGEASATIILQSTEEDTSRDTWQYVVSSNHNDANHISGPSRTGEGSYRVLRDLLKVINKSELSFINVHGTATVYNDEMESIAIHRAGLDDVPVNGLKGVFGHTLGAAGVVETILSMHSVDRGIILPTYGYSECGTSFRLNISHSLRQSDKKSFIKILSGFGGCNAGILYRKGGAQ